MLGLAAVAVIAMGLKRLAQAGSVAPKQYFTGVINGKDGNTTKPITITMNCPGPLQPGQTGHPLAGQTLAVHQLFPPASGTLGRTGNDAEIGAFFAAPPGAAQAVPQAAYLPATTAPSPRLPRSPCPAPGRAGSGSPRSRWSPRPGRPSSPSGTWPSPERQIFARSGASPVLEGAQTWVRWMPGCA